MSDSVRDWLSRWLPPDQVLDLNFVHQAPTAEQVQGYEAVVFYFGTHNKLSEVACWMQDLGYRLASSLTRQCRDIARFTNNYNFSGNGVVFVKEAHQATPGKNAIVTWASGHNPEFFFLTRVFLESIRKRDLDCEKYVFTHDLNVTERELFESYGFRIVDIDPSRIVNILVSRFRHWSDFLLGEGRVLNHVLLCDCKDVVFQKDPFVWSASFGDTSENFVLGFSEGWKHCQSEWNTNDQWQFAKGLGSDDTKATYPFGRWDVLNGGVVLGTPLSVSDLCVFVEESTITSYSLGGRCTDQAALNYAFRQASRPMTGEMIVISPKKDPFVAHGESMKLGLFEAEYRMENATLINVDTGEPFVLFHQWERTIHKDEILKSYIPLP